MLNQKQTQMLQLSNKFNVPTTFKNDAVTIWFDAKNQLSQQLGKLKLYV